MYKRRKYKPKNVIYINNTFNEYFINLEFLLITSN